MSPIDVLIWFGVILAGLIVLGVLAFLIVIVWAAAVGIRQMRDDEDKPEREIFTSGGGR